MFSVLSSWLSFFSTLSLVVLISVGLFMILVILMQRPKQEGLGAAFGGGMTNQMFGAHTTNVLEKLTFKLAILFIVFCFARSVLLAKQNKGITLISETVAAEQVSIEDTAQVAQQEAENMIEDIKAQLEEKAAQTTEQVAQEATQSKEEVVAEIPTELAK